MEAMRKVWGNFNTTGSQASHHPGFSFQNNCPFLLYLLLCLDQPEPCCAVDTPLPRAVLVMLTPQGSGSHIPMRKKVKLI